jgi:hypothetical protein
MISHKYMNKNAILTAAFLIACCLGLSSLCAQELVNIRPLIESAENKLYENGITKVLATRIDPFGKATITSYFVKNAESEKISRIETQKQLTKKLPTRVHINRPDGKWVLLSTVAICEPENVNKEIGAENIFERDTEAILGEIHDSETDGKKIRRISWCISDKLISDVNNTMTNFVKKNQTAPESQNNLADIVKSILGNAPYKYEQEIDRETGYIISKRIYTKEGKKLSDLTYQEITPNSDISMTIFEFPRDSKLLFPKTLSEYMEMLRHYSDKSITK